MHQAQLLRAAHDLQRLLKFDAAGRPVLDQGFGALVKDQAGLQGLVATLAYQTPGPAAIAIGQADQPGIAADHLRDHVDRQHRSGVWDLDVHRDQPAARLAGDRSLHRQHAVVGRPGRCGWRELPAQDLVKEVRVKGPSGCILRPSHLLLSHEHRISSLVGPLSIDRVGHDDCLRGQAVERGLQNLGRHLGLPLQLRVGDVPDQG